jgi:hypothetical protein
MKDLNETSKQLSQKYVISPIDGETYCRANGIFLRHLRANGYQSYYDFFVSYYPELTQYCVCGKICFFNKTDMTYGKSCGNFDCRGKIISATLSTKNEEFWTNKNQKVIETLDKNREINKIKREASYEKCRVNGIYMNAVTKRRQTCYDRYGDPTFSNPKQASATKLNWSEERKQLFLSRVRNALGGKWMNDFTTTETWINRSIKLWEKGLCVHPNDRSDWYKYKGIVWKLTNRNYRKNKHIINPNNYIRTTGGDGYHLDHIIPIHYGFVNGILPTIIADVNNLQMLTWRENIIKSNKYDDSTQYKQL